MRIPTVWCGFVGVGTVVNVVLYTVQYIFFCQSPFFYEDSSPSPVFLSRWFSSMNWHKLRVGQVEAPTIRLIQKVSLASAHIFKKKIYVKLNR
jgi:hypothetical protein